MRRGKHAAPKVRNGRVRWGLLGMVFGLMLATSAPVMAEHVEDPTPSTNDENRDNGWAHFNVIDLQVGEVTVEFVSTRNFPSCFEYRVDGEGPNSPDNYNTEIHDGLWDFECVTDETIPMTITADELVEIRMVFGPEKDERFDWTPIEIPAPPTPPVADDCKVGGYEGEGFSNQGRCIASINANENADFESNPPPRGRSGDAPGHNK